MAKKRKFFDLSPTGTAAVRPRDNLNFSANPITGNFGGAIKTGEVTTSVGGNPATGSIAPKIQIGEGVGPSLGATAGSIGGSAFGPVGSAVGSAAGSILGGQLANLTGGNSEAAKETKARKSAYGNLNSLWDNGSFTFPDGSTFDYNADSKHSWKNPDKKVNGIDRDLFSYETDYTNDLDYVAGITGINLSRLINGGTNKAIDQAGNLLGNSFLGKAGYGADFNQQNFNSVMTNAKAQYAKAGIQNKEEALALANKAFADKRINDTDYAAAQQVASLVFDNDFGKASQLMAGRWNGIGTAAKTPTGENKEGTRQNRAGRIYSPVLSPEEAMLSVQPLVDIYLQNRERGKQLGLNRGLQQQAKMAQGIALATGVYKIGDKLTGGALSSTIANASKWAIGGIAGIGQDIGEALGLTTNTDTSDTFSDITSGISDIAGGSTNENTFGDVANMANLDIGLQSSGF